MKNENETRNALVSHRLNSVNLLELPEQLQIVATKLNWSVDRLTGYIEGVEWAYEWVLEELP